MHEHTDIQFHTCATFGADTVIPIDSRSTYPFGSRSTSVPFWDLNVTPRVCIAIMCSRTE
jgi:hypothetical protein